MAARKSRHVSVDTDTSDDGTIENVSSEPRVASCDSRTPLRSSLFAVALIVFLVWAASLVTMAVIVDAPATLNVVQIKNAEIILQGTIDPAEDGVFRVDRSWPADATDVGVMIEELGELSLQPDQSYLMPVERTNDGAFRVVVTPKPEEIRLVYPANDETIATLEDILAAR